MAYHSMYISHRVGVLNLLIPFLAGEGRPPFELAQPGRPFGAAGDSIRRVVKVLAKTSRCA
jgi:hypothetical protein